MVTAPSALISCGRKWFDKDVVWIPHVRVLLCLDLSERVAQGLTTHMCTANLDSGLLPLVHTQPVSLTWPKFIHPGFSTPVSLPQLSLPVSGCSIPGSAYLLSRSILVSPCEDLLEAEPWPIKPSVPCFQVGLLGLFSSRWCSLEDPSSLRNKLPGIT